MSGPTKWEDYREHAHDWCLRLDRCIESDEDRVRSLAQLLSDCVDYVRADERAATEREIAEWLCDVTSSEVTWAIAARIERGEYRKAKP